jgi:pyruvate,water dikinase
VVIECVFGHGERLVSGLVAPDRFVVDAAGHIRARIGDRESGVDANDERHRVRRTIRTLRDDEVLAVADLARRAEAGFGVPVDIEFCMELRTIWLVQCRPITTLGGRA